MPITEILGIAAALATIYSVFLRRENRNFKRENYDLKLRVQQLEVQAQNVRGPIIIVNSPNNVISAPQAYFQSQTGGGETNGGENE